MAASPTVRKKGQAFATAHAAPRAEKPGSDKLSLSLADLVLRWRPAPWLFVREMFGATPDAWQNVILHAVVGLDVHENPLPLDQPYDKIALKACKGPGKTCVEAWIAWWFLFCFQNPKVVATSITGENLRDNLWTEMALWRAKAPILMTLFEWRTERIELREYPETWFMSARTWPKDADKTKQADTLSGIHGRYTLLILDESGGIPEGVMAAGLAHHSTKDVDGDEIAGEQVHITLQCGNPTSVDGSLGVACTRDRDKWFVYEITGDPNDPNRAPRMDIKWCQEQIDTWGADSPWVLVNVFGKFPPVQDNKLLGPEIVRAAMTFQFGHDAVWKKEPRIMGLDVARSLASDTSALCRRQGPVVFPFRIWRIDDLMELSSQVAFEYSRWPADVVFVDMTGLGGGVVDRLAQLQIPVVGINFGSAASDQRFADKRSEMWWNMHLAVKGSGKVPGVALPDDAELVIDLTGPTISFNDRSKLKLESKEFMKKRGLKSPNKGDALALTYAEPVAARIEVPASTVSALRGVQARVEYDPFRSDDRADFYEGD